MEWTPYHANLREALAGLFYTRDLARSVIVDAGITPANVTWSENPRILWQSVIERALRRSGGVAALIDAALRLEPGEPFLLEAKNGDVHRARGVDIEGASWHGPTDPESLEKIIGPESQLLPISFLSVGHLRAAAVCRIVRADRTVGTGFLVADDVLVTNNHVLPDAATAATAKAEFNFELAPSGLPTEVDRCDLAPQVTFHTWKDLDLTAVRLERRMGQRYGVLDVAMTKVERNDRLSIIQHAGGLEKQVALSNNAVVYVDEDRIQYLTDTLGGSSGSPVFDRAWRLVAVHRAGGWLHEPGSKQRFYRNEGVPVTRLHDALTRAGLLSSGDPHVG